MRKLFSCLKKLLFFTQSLKESLELANCSLCGIFQGIMAELGDEYIAFGKHINFST